MIINNERVLLLIKNRALPVNREERFFLEGYNMGNLGFLLKDVLANSKEIDNMVYNEYFNFTVGYAMGQAYENDNNDELQ